MDYKLPSSGEEGKSLWSMLPHLRTHDVLKFVIGTEEDLQVVRDILHDVHVEAEIFLTPVARANADYVLEYTVTPKELVDFSMSLQPVVARIGLQLHKYIWPPAERGV